MVDAPQAKEAETVAVPDELAPISMRRQVAIDLAKAYIAMGGALFSNAETFDAVAIALGCPAQFVFATAELLLVRFIDVTGSTGNEAAKGDLDKSNEGLGTRDALQTSAHFDNQTLFVNAPKGMDLRKLDLVTDLMTELLGGGHPGTPEPTLPTGVPAGSASVVSAVQGRLAEIAALPPLIPDWAKDFIILPLISAGMAAMFYSGPWISCALALPLGFVQTFVRRKAGRANPAMGFITNFLTAFVVGMLSGVIVGSGTFKSDGVCFGSLGLAGVVWMIPGMKLVTSITHLASGDIGAGTTGFASAALAVFLLGFGLEAGLQLTFTFGMPSHPTSNCVPAEVNNLWFFLLFPPVGILHCAALEAPFPRGYLLGVPIAGLAFAAWDGLQFIPAVGKTGPVAFGGVLIVSMLAAAVPSFFFARITRRSAFPYIYLAMQFIVPGGIALKGALDDFGSAAGFTGGGFATKMLIGALGATVGTFVAHTIVWPGWKWTGSEAKDPAWQHLPYR